MHKIAKSTLFLLCLNIFGLTCSQEMKGISDSATAYAEFLRFCGTFKPIHGHFKIIDAGIPWGKWVKGPDDMTEIGSPINQTINEGETFRFCTAGQAFYPGGTAADVVIVETTSNVDLPVQKTWITWSVAFVSSFWQKVKYSIEFYNITTHHLPIKNCEHNYVYELKRWR